MLSPPGVICLPTPPKGSAEAQRDGFAGRVRALLLRVLVLSRGCSSGCRNHRIPPKAMAGESQETEEQATGHG